MFSNMKRTWIFVCFCAFVPIALNYPTEEKTNSNMEQKSEEHYYQDIMPNERIKTLKGLHTISTSSISNEKHGTDFKEHHNKETTETKGLKRTHLDEANQIHGHATAEQDFYSANNKDAKSDKKRTKEKGFHNSYGKKEYRKYLNFFGNGMENGEYLKYGHVHDQHEHQNSNQIGGGQKKSFEIIEKN